MNWFDKRIYTCNKERSYMKEKLNVLIKQNNAKMFNFDCIAKGDIKEHNLKQPEIPDNPYRILIILGSGSGKTNALLNLVNHEPDIDKNYLYAKDPSEKKCRGKWYGWYL